jgi:hypothetical protein
LAARSLVTTAHAPLLPRLALAVCAIIVLTTTAPGQPNGVVEGRIIAVDDAPVQPGDAAAPVVDYAQFVLVIRRAGSDNEVARIAPDPRGTYRVSLPPGDYVAGVARSGAKPANKALQPFAVKANETTRLDLHVVPDLRKSGPVPAESI